MSIAGHLSRAMLSRYSRVRMEEKLGTMDEIVAPQRATNRKREAETEWQQQVAMSSQ